MRPRGLGRSLILQGAKAPLSPLISHPLRASIFTQGHNEALLFLRSHAVVGDLGEAVRNENSRFKT